MYVPGDANRPAECSAGDEPFASASAVGAAWCADLAFVGVAGAVHAPDGGAE